jgi:hypothetical protein
VITTLSFFSFTWGDHFFMKGLHRTCTMNEAIIMKGLHRACTMMTRCLSAQAAIAPSCCSCKLPSELACCVETQLLHWNAIAREDAVQRPMGPRLGISRGAALQAQLANNNRRSEKKRRKRRALAARRTAVRVTLLNSS